MIKLSSSAYELVANAEVKLQSKFAEIDKVNEENTLKVLNAFIKNRVEVRHFAGTTGYGYDDAGRDCLNKICADIMHTEDAIFSPQLSSGTQAISQALLGILRPDDTIYSISGMPYDTLQKVIYGEEGKDIGSLKDYNIKFEYCDLIDNNFDLKTIENYMLKVKPTAVYIQRSRGYVFRDALTITQIEKAIKLVKDINPATIVIVDNCYGELTETREPTDVGADLVIGSLIKNLGAGIAPSGAYVAGKKWLVERISYRMTSPALGNETGSYEAGYKAFYQGFFLASNVVASAKKGALLTSQIFRDLGYETLPSENVCQSDIVACIKFADKNKLIEFCRAIQHSSPIDSNAVVEPCDMPGYENQVIMASGSFNQGSSIELSCDAPIREPFIAYIQGGLTYAHYKIALINSLSLCDYTIKK